MLPHFCFAVCLRHILSFKCSCGGKGAAIASTSCHPQKLKTRTRIPLRRYEWLPASGKSAQTNNAFELNGSQRDRGAPVEGQLKEWHHRLRLLGSHSIAAWSRASSCASRHSPLFLLFFYTLCQGSSYSKYQNVLA